MPQRKKVTEKDIQTELEKTTQLLRKIKGERINPGIPLHLAPKGKKKKKRTRSKSKSKPRSKTKSKPRSKSKSKSKPRSKTKSKSKPRSKSKSKPRSSSKKKKLEKMGIEPRLLFGLDEDELGALLNNPQLGNKVYLNDFLPPDDDNTPPPGRYGFTGPALGYDYVPGADPMAAETLQRTTNKPIRQEVLPEVLRPRFG